MTNLIDDLSVPKQVHDYRLELCKNCPEVLNDKKNINTAMCGKCGCFVYIKSGLKDFTCPGGKW